MKTKTLFLVLALCFGTVMTFESCDKGENTDCPEGKWDNYNDCMDAIQAAGSDCDCETEGSTGLWFAVYDP